MIRILILIGFTFLFMHLHATGDISKYINMKYSYISFSAIFILGFLTLVQFYIYGKSEDGDHHHDETCAAPDCGHDHHKKPSRLKSMTVNSILIFPIFSGLFFPIASLDSETVKTKGFHFKGLENEGDFGEHQFLKPDTSVYYGKESYNTIMDKELKPFTKGDTVVLNDKNYLKGMESIYYKPGIFLGKDIQFKGFTYNAEDQSTTKSNELFLLRFGVIHCIADSGVFGMMVEFPKGTTFPNDKWIEVDGTIETMYYQPFKADIPYVKVKSWKEIEKPEEEYVYRGY
jgi:putative membrane protein